MIEKIKSKDVMKYTQLILLNSFNLLFSMIQNKNCLHKLKNYAKYVS